MNSSVTRTISNGCFYFLSDVHLLKGINKKTTTDFCMWAHVAVHKKQDEQYVYLCVYRCLNSHTSFVGYSNAYNYLKIMKMLSSLLVFVVKDRGHPLRHAVTFPNRDVPVWISFPNRAIVSEWEAGPAETHTMSPHQLEHLSVWVCVWVCVCAADYRARALCPSLHLLKPPRLDQGHFSPLLYHGCGSVCTFYCTCIGVCVCVCVCVFNRDRETRLIL